MPSLKMALLVSKVMATTGALSPYGVSYPSGWPSGGCQDGRFHSSYRNSQKHRTGTRTVAVDASPLPSYSCADMADARMANSLDEFQGQIATYFRQLTLATAYLKIGSQHLKTAPATAAVSLKLADDLTTEPMQLRELLPYTGAVAAGVAELFQMKAIAAWSDLLNKLFTKFMNAHLDGIKFFPELKTRTARIDFSITSDINSQLREGLSADFAFEQYADRIRLINHRLNPNALCDGELLTIKKHVFIRNAVQHHQGKVYDDMLKKLGSTQLALLDSDGNAISLGGGQPIHLFVPELDKLKRALFLVTNTWKDHFA